MLFMSLSLSLVNIGKRDYFRVTACIIGVFACADFECLKLART